MKFLVIQLKIWPKRLRLINIYNTKLDPFSVFYIIDIQFQVRHGTV